MGAGPGRGVRGARAGLRGVVSRPDRYLRPHPVRRVLPVGAGVLVCRVLGQALAVEWPQRPYPDAGTVYYYYFHLRPQTIPAGRSWIPGGTAYSDAVQYGHATPSRVVEPFAILIAGYERVFYVYGPLFGLILVMGLGGVARIQRRPLRLIWLARSRRPGSMLPWVTAVVLLVFPIAVADFDYRYLLPVPPFACLAAGLAFAPAREAVAPVAPASLNQDQLTAEVPGPTGQRRGTWTGQEPGVCRRGRAAGRFGGGGDRIARVVRGRRIGQLLGPGGVRRILSTGESAGRSRRAQAR